MQRKRFILYSKQQGNAFKFIVTQFHLLKSKMPYTNCTLKQFSESSQNSNIKFKKKMRVKIKRIRNKKVATFMRTAVGKKSIEVNAGRLKTVTSDGQQWLQRK